MYLIFLISCACIIFIQAHPVNKRDIFDNLPFGGNLGCVVTGNTLYINGLQDRQLTPSEITELQQYQSSLNSFQQQLQQFKQQMHQMRQMNGDRNNGQWNGGRMHARMGPMMSNGPNGPNGPQDNNNMPTPPTPPTRPSFCNDNVTTQYIFDGCKVQDNKVYIGNTYARDLTPAEQNQLQQFNNQMDAFNDQLNQQIQQQLNGLMTQSSDMSNDYNGSDGNDYNSGSTDVSSTTSSTDSDSTTATSLPQPPQPPNFCTAIF